MQISDIKNRLKEIGTLPSGYDIFPEVFRLVNNPNSNIMQFEQVVKKDPGLSVQVLKLVNSPFYGLSRKVTGLRQALALLGVQEIYRIVMNVNYFTNFQKMFDDLSIDFNMIWRHFEATATAAQILAEKFMPNRGSEAYVIGLLHDTGKLILDQFFSAEWREILLEHKEQQDDILKIERTQLGADHAQIAAALFAMWKLPLEIIEPIQFHHRPFEAKNHAKLAALLFVADRMAMYYTTNAEVKSCTQEDGQPDKMWEEVVGRYPEFNILASAETEAEFGAKLAEKLHRD